MNLWIAFKYQPIFDFSSKFDFDSKSDKTFALLMMKQEYFTINADYGNDGAFSLLSDDVTELDIKKAISKDEIPVYVSSVCYGCFIVISIQTSQSFNELENELNVDSGFLFNTKSSLKKLKDNARYSCDFYINGGSEKLKKAIKEYNMRKILKILCNEDDQERNLGIQIFYQLSKISNNSPFDVVHNKDYYYAKVKKPLPDENIICVAYVIPDTLFKKCSNFDFIEEFNTTQLIIKVSTVKKSELFSRLKNKDYLKTFKILMFGGISGFYNYSKLQDCYFIDNYIIPFHENGGVILFLHDFIIKKRICQFEKLIIHLGLSPNDQPMKIFKKKFDKINLSPRFADSGLDEIPFKVNFPMDIIKTYETMKYMSDKIVISADNDPDVHYYCEDMENRIADCSFGNNSKITIDEQKLFYNILYHLGQLSI